MKSRLAPIIFAAVLVVLAFALFRGKEGAGLVGGWRRNTDQRAGPEETLFAMVQAAQRGDTEAYFDCFWGPLRTRLEQTGRDMGRGGFAKYLSGAAEAIKGVAVIGQPEPLGADLKVQAEMVYEDKSELQEFILTRRRGRWRISGMDNPRRIKTVIPYGTEAYPLMPPAGSEDEEARP